MPNHHGDLPGIPVRVSDLTQNVNRATLRHHFSQIGPCRVEMQYARGGVTRGFAFVYYYDEDDARAACGIFNGAVLDGRMIGVRRHRTSQHSRESRQDDPDNPTRQLALANVALPRRSIRCVRKVVSHQCTLECTEAIHIAGDPAKNRWNTDQERLVFEVLAEEPAVTIYHTGLDLCDFEWEFPLAEYLVLLPDQDCMQVLGKMLRSKAAYYHERRCPRKVVVIAPNKWERDTVLLEIFTSIAEVVVRHACRNRQDIFGHCGNTMAVLVISPEDITATDELGTFGDIIFTYIPKEQPTFDIKLTEWRPSVSVFYLGSAKNPTDVHRVEQVAAQKNAGNNGNVASSVRS